MFSKKKSIIFFKFDKLITWLIIWGAITSIIINRKSIKEKLVDIKRNIINYGFNPFKKYLWKSMLFVLKMFSKNKK